MQKYAILQAQIKIDFLNNGKIPHKEKNWTLINTVFDLWQDIDIEAGRQADRQVEVPVMQREGHL